jgi:hypothetical protein
LNDKFSTAKEIGKFGQKSAGWCLPWALHREHPRIDGGTQKKRLKSLFLSQKGAETNRWWSRDITGHTSNQ